MLLNNITLLGKSIDLADEQAREDSNVVTILMGSNGSGKSRIFQAICSAFIRIPQNDMMMNHLTDVVNLSDPAQIDSLSYTQDGDVYSLCHFRGPLYQKYDIDNSGTVILTSEYPYERVNNCEVYNVNDDILIEGLTSRFLCEVKNSNNFILKKNGVFCDVLIKPNKVLAVTGSPYDKFPFRGSFSRQHDLSPYVYLGTREKRQAGYRRNRGYLSYKFDQLGASFIKLLLKPRQEYFDFSKMLNFLNISSSFTLKLYLSERFSMREPNQENILEMVRSIKFFKDKDHDLTSCEIDKDDLSKRLLDAIEYVAGKELLKGEHHFNNPIEISCNIDLEKDNNDKLRLSSLELLSEYDLVELEDVVFSKSESKKEFLLSQASSGELSLLFTMSSIAGEIKNGSLILIDEPELSLHPEWQLNFLSLLNDIFSNYKGCHFIIATHSPNLISSIPVDNAYIVNLDADEIKILPSKLYHNRSADFQLASVFNAPGNNNEYLLSQVIEVLDHLCKSKEFNADSLHRAKWLLAFENKVGDGDKVKILLNILRKTMEALNIR